MAWWRQSKQFSFTERRIERTCFLRIVNDSLVRIVHRTHVVRASTRVSRPGRSFLQRTHICSLCTVIRIAQSLLCIRKRSLRSDFLYRVMILLLLSTRYTQSCVNQSCVSCGFLGIPFEAVVVLSSFYAACFLHACLPLPKRFFFLLISPEQILPRTRFLHLIFITVWQNSIFLSPESGIKEKEHKFTLET